MCVRYASSQSKAPLPLVTVIPKPFLYQWNIFLYYTSCMPFVVGSIKQAKIGKTMLALGVLCITCSGSKKNHCSSFCKWILPNTMCQSPNMALFDTTSPGQASIWPEWWSTATRITSSTLDAYSSIPPAWHLSTSPGKTMLWPERCRILACISACSYPRMRQKVRCRIQVPRFIGTELIWSYLPARQTVPTGYWGSVPHAVKAFPYQ